MKPGYLSSILKGAALLLLLFVSSPSRAQTNLWIGPADGLGVGDWELDTNWSLGVVPTGVLSGVQIDGNPLLASTVTVSQSQTIGNLTVDLGDALVVDPAVSVQASGTVQNAGTITLQVNNTGGLEFAGLLDNAAGASFQMDGGTIASLPPSASAVLQNNGTIAGNGRIGLSNRFMGLVNNALIDANVMGASLLVTGVDSGSATQTSLPSYTNAGTLQATNGGILRLSRFQELAPLNNAGGVIQADSGSLVTLLNARVVDGQINTLDTATTGEGTIELGANVSLLGVDVNALVDFEFNSSLYDSTFSNMKSLRVGGSELRLRENIVIDGGGMIELGPGGVISGENLGANPTFARLVNVDNTINVAGTGTASLGENLLVENNAAIMVDGSGARLDLDVAGPAGLPTTQAAWTNAGTISSTGGAILIMRDSASRFDNTNGVLETDPSSLFDWGDNHIIGGTLRGPATPPSRGRGMRGSGILEDLRLEGIVNSTQPITLRGTIENTGSLSGAVLVDTSEVTMTGGGILSLRSIARSTTTQPVSLINEDNTLQVGNSLQINAVQLVNRSIFEAVTNFTFNQVTSSGTDPSLIVNANLIRAQGGNFLDLTGIAVQNYEFDATSTLVPGRIFAGAGSTVLVGDVSGGTLEAEGVSTLRAEDGQFNSPTETVPLNLIGDIEIQNVNLAGTISNADTLATVGGAGDILTATAGVVSLAGPGTLVLDREFRITTPASFQHASTHSIVGSGASGQIALDGAIFINEGRIEAPAGTMLAVSDVSTGPMFQSQFVQRGRLLSSGDGQLTVGPFANFTNENEVTASDTSRMMITYVGTASNQSMLNALDTSVVTLAGSAASAQPHVFENASGAVVHVESTIDVNNSDFVNRLGGLVRGTGTIDVSTDANTFINEGTLAPDTATPPSLDVLSVIGDFQQTTTGTFQVDLVGTTAGQFDTLSVTGDALLGGELELNLVDLGGGLLTPQLGDTFVIVATNGTGNTISGAFESIDDTNAMLDPMFSWRVFYSATRATLTVVDMLMTDFDDNGVVGPSDLAKWQQDYGLNNESDGNGDGTTDGLDFLKWQRELTETRSFQTGGSMRITAVPEPEAGLLLGFMSALLLSRRPSAKCY